MSVSARVTAMRAAVFVLVAIAAVSLLQGQEPSVREGVNERFLSTDLDTTAMTERFERDEREVFVRRHDIVAALDLRPGMRVADVGAGSGFFVSLMSEAVGRTGHVYAVEIAPRWVEHLTQKIDDEELRNVTVVQGKERSVELPEGALDLIFSSDTYHHFEYPQSSLASIARALKPGGRWVIVDYDKIPGVTPASRMEHLRLGKADAIQEVTAAGFTMEAIVDLNLDQNYMAIFRRP